MKMRVTLFTSIKSILMKKLFITTLLLLAVVSISGINKLQAQNIQLFYDAGREGAALQIGGSIGNSLGKLFNFDEKDTHVVIMCGMSAVFSALFGTPLTATLFSMEVVSVGVFYYAAFVPCLCSSLVSLQIARLFGCQSVCYQLNFVLNVTPMMIIKLIGLTFVVAAFSIVFVIWVYVVQ